MTDLAEIEALANAGQKINAIKEYRALTGLGLKEAKDAVEHFQAHGEWPSHHSHDIHAGLAQRSAQLSAQPPAVPLHPLQAVEQLMAQGQIIQAIKELRSLTSWGLKELKDAVDEYRERGRWPGTLVVAVERSSGASAPAPTPAPTPSPAPAPTHPSAITSQAQPHSAARQAVADHLGHAPDIHLVARARRSSRDGHLVMLRDRACFVHDRSLLVDPEIHYDSVTHARIVPGARAVLHVGVYGYDEQLLMDAADADAALALLRVFGR